MVDVIELDSKVVKQAEEPHDRALDLRARFGAHFATLGQGVQSVKNSLAKWETAKKDVPQEPVPELPEPDENLEEANGFKQAFRSIWEAAEQVSEIEPFLPRTNSSVQYLLSSESAAN